MLKWLRNKIKRWLEDDQKVDTIECIIEGRIKRVAVEGVRGMSLLVSDGEGMWLVGADQCLDKRSFWRAWDQKSTDEFVWEDGTHFKLDEMR